MNVRSMTSPAGSGRRLPLWLALLVAASIAFTLGFACAVPFAAFSAVAATTLSRRNGLLLTVGLWLANQIVGFAFLGYPSDPTTLAWGLTLGVVALLTTVAAYWANGKFGNVQPMARIVVSFAAAFAVYEGALFLASLSPLGGTEDFALGIVAYILALNAVALVGLYALNRFATAVGFIEPAGTLATVR